MNIKRGCRIINSDRCPISLTQDCFFKSTGSLCIDCRTGNKPILDPDKCVSIEDFPIIICCDTGVMWVNQSGHHACSQQVAEGFVIPINKEYCTIAGGVCGYMVFGDDEYDETEEGRQDIAAGIDSELKEYSDQIIQRIRFDYSRINEMMEGWFPVMVFLWSECEKRGYLCTPNCD